LPAPKDPEAYVLWRERLKTRKSRHWTAEQRQQASEAKQTRRQALGLPPVQRKLSPEDRAMADAKRRERMSALALEINNRPAIREKRSQSNRDRWKALGDQHPTMRLEVQKRAAQSRIGLKRSAETKTRQSLARTAYLMAGDMKAKVPFASAKQRGAGKFLRSSWEMLDGDPEVEWFQYEAVRVPYDKGGVRRYTVVDFLVKYRNGILGLVEIKPAYAVTRSPEKIQAIESFAGEKGWAYGVLTESELFA
jgi:hypothetical protein